MSSQAVIARSIIRRDRPAQCRAVAPFIASRHAERAASIAGSRASGRPARWWRSATPRGSRIVRATAAWSRPESSTKAACAKSVRPASTARRIRPALSCRVVRRCRTRRAVAAAPEPSHRSSATRSPASRVIRAQRSTPSQPQSVTKSDRDRATASPIAWRTSGGRSGRASSASRRTDSPPQRSTMRSSRPVVIRAVGFPISVTSVSRSPISASAPETACDRWWRAAITARIASEPSAAASTRSASVSTGERARIGPATSGTSQERATTRGRGARAEGAQVSASARRTRGDGSSRRASSAVLASQASSAPRSP